MNMKIFAAGLCALSLAACGDNTPNPEMLRGANFVTENGGTQITLAFDENEMMAAGQIVNLYHGPYSADGDKIKFGDIATTMMMGPADAMQAEQDYLQFLATVETYDLDDGRLILRNGDGREYVFAQVDTLPTDDDAAADTETVAEETVVTETVAE